MMFDERWVFIRYRNHDGGDLRYVDVRCLFASYQLETHNFQRRLLPAEHTAAVLTPLI
jgi:hypothetical protein